MKRTNRGFAIYTELTDAVGNSVRVQHSSEAGRRRCWIFSQRGGADGEFHRPSATWQAFSPYLSPAEARRIAKALLRFADGD